MKKTIFVPSLVFFLILISNSQPFWKQVNPKPIGNHLYAVHMFDSTTIWGFGQAGMMLYTKDFGENWLAYYESGFQETIFSCHFFDNNRGIIVGEKGAVYYTSNQCKTWNLVNSNIKSTLKAVHFIGSFGVAVGENGSIIKSENSGKLWQRVDFNKDYTFNAVFLISKKHWFIVGNRGVIVETNTAGKSWHLKIHESKQKLNDVYFLNPQKGFVSSVKGLLLTTLNGGKFWHSKIIARKRDLYQIHFIDDQNGLISGEGGIIERTTDGGNKWKDNFSGSHFDLFAIDLWDKNHGVILGAGGNRTKIFKNTSRFITHTDYSGSTNKHIYGVVAINETDIFACGWKAAFLFSDDKGLTWQKPSPKTPQDFADVHFVDQNFGWAVGQDGEIRISPNGGKNWMSQYSGIKYEDLTSVYFINKYSGWIVGEKGTMLQTYNMGTNWNKYKSEITIDLNSINFSDDYNGFVVGDSGLYMITKNGGNFWEKKFFPSSKNLKVITMDDENGYVITENDELFRTFDMGETWQQVLLNSNVCFNSIFSQYNFTWIVGNNGKILYSNNNMFDWVEVFSTTRHDLNDIDFYDFDTGHACGGFGTILKFEGKKRTLDSTITNRGGAAFYLKMVQDGLVKGVIKNLNGEMVASVINNVYQKGDYSFYIPAQEYDLNKGIHFLEITLTDKTTIKKVVVF